jgi:hypothetical protein
MLRDLGASFHTRGTLHEMALSFESELDFNQFIHGALKHLCRAFPSGEKTSM